MDIPVYLVAGFLDSGKTNFINGVLEDGFARQDKTHGFCYYMWISGILRVIC